MNRLLNRGAFAWIVSRFLSAVYLLSVRCSVNVLVLEPKIPRRIKIMRYKIPFTSVFLAVVIAAVLPVATVAQPGTLIQNVPLPVTGIGVSVAVDCQGAVYYTLYQQTNLYVMDKDGNLQTTLPIIDAATGVSLFIDEMAFENSGGAGTLWGQVHDSNPVDVYTIDPSTGSATFAFTSQTNSIGTFRDGIAFDATDNTIWISGDISSTIEHYQTDGTFINQITPKDAAGGTLGSISGVTVGSGDLLYLGQNGAVQIVQVKKSNGDFIASFASPGGARDEGLECDPVNFAPKLALWSREFNSPGFLSVIELEPNTCGCGGGEPVIAVDLDIKPTSCPNPLNMKPFEDPNLNAKQKKGGLLPVAVLGSNDLDVMNIDVSSLLLEGVAPLKSGYEDVAAPVVDPEECECTEAGPDGFMDLTLKFDKAEIAAALGAVVHGDVIALTLTGQMLDGTALAGTDCIWIRYKTLEPPTPLFGDDGVVLGPAVPNPFNPATRISYLIPSEGYVKLSVYDVAGRLVEQLVSEMQSAGEYVVEWDAGRMASGIYFYRIEVGDFTETRKMMLIK
jgi:hypothetical protein